MVLRPGFKATRDGGLEVRLPGNLRQAMLAAFADLATLLEAAEPEPPTPSASPDPLEALTGMSPRAQRVTPDDPALLRLRPDAYGAEVDEGAAARDYRRFTEGDLASLQRSRVSLVREALTSGDRFTLDGPGAQALLGALNDLRLVLGTRLDVAEDPADWPAAGDPRAPAFELYGVLGYLQERLLDALGAPDGR